eukprot:685680-Ditylum_brightwellii.AAC.1
MGTSRERKILTPQHYSYLLFNVLHSTYYAKQTYKIYPRREKKIESVAMVGRGNDDDGSSVGFKSGDGRCEGGDTWKDGDDNDDNDDDSGYSLER